MSTKVIAVIFVLLLGIAALLFTGGGTGTPAPATHVMPDGSVMEDSNPVMETMPQGGHMMPDGTMMNADKTHTMPDGSVMLDTDTRMETNTAPAPVSKPTPTPAPAPTMTDEMPMDHSMMGHTM
jgi:hypothetical protein